MKTITWFLVCDAGRARVLSYEKHRKTWDIVEAIDHPAGRARTIDLVGDKPGRVQQSGHSATRPGMEPQTDPSDVVAERFARRLGGMLEDGRNENRFSRLVLVAPPRFLGLLRKELEATPVAEHVAASIDKDYTRFDLRELEERLEPHCAD